MYSPLLSLTIHGADDRLSLLRFGRMLGLEAGDGILGLIRPLALAIASHG